MFWQISQRCAGFLSGNVANIFLMVLNIKPIINSYSKFFTQINLLKFSQEKSS